MYRVAIVEDENEAVEAIEKCLVRYSSDEGINFDVMVYDTGLKFLDAYSPAFDIVFMDIEMPDIDGIKTAEKLRQMDSCVGLVFITNLARYAIKGYEYDALDYILKPLSYPAFKLKLDRIFQRIKKNDKKIIITTRTGQNAVGINSIYYVEVSGHNLIYHTETGDYSEYGTLKEVLKKLPETQFMKCNNRYLVNLGHVRGYDGSVLTVGDYKIEISRSRKKDFISAYNAYRMAGGSDDYR